MKWLLEYSKEQNEFHIKSEDKRKCPNGYNEICSNGYTVISVCDSENEAFEKLYKFIKIRNENPNGLDMLLDCLNDLDSDILAMVMDYKIKRRLK